MREYIFYSPRGLDTGTISTTTFAADLGLTKPFLLVVGKFVLHLLRLATQSSEVQTAAEMLPISG